MPSSRFSTRGRELLLACSVLVLQACSMLPFPLQPGAWFRPQAETMQIRLLDVAYPLLTAAAPWCPFDMEPTYGLFLRDSSGNSSLRGQAVVAYVHPRLPAADAGLSVGDVILQVNTVSVTEDSATRVGQLIDRLTRAKIQPLQLDILRGDQRRTLALTAVPACHYALHALPTNLINGITDGRRIGVTQGALRFFSSDDELGWILAHEIGHNILNHVQNAKLQAMLRAFLMASGEGSDPTGPSPTGPSPTGPSLEAQADYVGAYLMALAGYDLSAIKRVWERLQRLEARQGGRKSRLAQTHPSTTARLAVLEITLQEIEARRQSGQPLQMGFEEGGF